jgi:hypothetical protein
MFLSVRFATLELKAQSIETGLSVLDDLDLLALTPRTFKRASIVVRLVGLNGNEPHLRTATFAKRTAYYPRVRNDLNFSHGTPYLAFDRFSAD